jgi:phage terminase large subunit
MSAVRGYQLSMAGETGVILCAREFQNSLDESSMEEVKQAISSEPWLRDFYDIGERYIRTKDGRIKYVFSGLRHNLESIKSKAKILLCWIDEAEPVSEQAYQKLLPTIREGGSECWVTWNPEERGSATDKRFRQEPPSRSVSAEVNYTDNPWFPDELDEQRREDQELLDAATYAWIWEGKYRENSDAQVLHGKVRVKEFEPGPDWDGPYHGIDWGFSQDPTAATKSWIHDKRIWVEREAGGVQIETPDIPPVVSRGIPGIERYEVLADNARPETISQVRRCGLPKCVAAKKWSGSVEDGVEYLRGFKEIVIHPRCKETIRESRLYSYKVDKRSEQILPDIVDKHNHYIDSLRYAHDKMIRKRDRTVTMLKPKGF